MKKLKTYLKLFILRLKITRKIFKSKHFLILYVPTADIVTLIDNNEIKHIDASYLGMMEHQAWQIIKIAAEGIDNVELICKKATFEAHFEEKAHIENKVQ